MFNLGDHETPIYWYTEFLRLDFFNLNHWDWQGNTLLLYACLYDGTPFQLLTKHQDICDLLISKGANFNCQHGFRLLMENCKKKEMDSLEILIKASQNGITDKVRMLLKHSLQELNKKNKDGLSSLHSVCMNNRLEVVRL